MHSTRRDFSHTTWSGFDEDGFLLVQADAYGNPANGAGGSAFQLNHPYGFASRPHDPDAPADDGSPPRWCTLMVEKDGSTRIGWLGYDPRFIQDLATLSKGGAAMYAGWKEGTDWRVTFATIDGKTGTFHFYRPTGDSALSCTFGVDGGGEPTIELRHSDGSIISMFDGSIVLKCPNGKNYIQVSDDGIVLKGPITQMGGLSTPGGVPLVKYPEFAQFATAVNLALDAINASLSEVSTAVPPAAAGFGTAMGVLTAGKIPAETAVAAALTAVTKGT
jgi:hypothetical protein